MNLLSSENAKLSKELEIVLNQRNESSTNLKENESQVLALQVNFKILLIFNQNFYFLSNFRYLIKISMFNEKLVKNILVKNIF